MKDKFSAPPWTLMLTRPARKGDRGSVMITAGGPWAIDCTESGRTFEESAANGKLVAAGPTLVYALRILLKELEQPAAQKDSGEHSAATDTRRVELIKAALRQAGVIE